MAAKHIEPKTTKNRIDFLPQISDEDSSFRKDLSFLGALFLLWTLIGVIKDTVPEKIEHHFDGNVCFWTLLGFAVVYESLFYLSNRKLQKQTIKEVLLAE